MQSVMEDCESITSFVPSKFKPRKVFANRDFPEGLKQCCTRNINLTSKTDDAYESDNQSEEQVAAPRKVFAIRDFPEGLKQCVRDIHLISKTDDAYESDNLSEEPVELFIASDDSDVESERMESVITCDQEVADLVTVSAMPGNSNDQSSDRSLKRARNQDQDNVKEDASYDDLEDGTVSRKTCKVVEDSDESEELYEVPYAIVGKFGILTRYPAYYMDMTQSLYSAEDDADESGDEDEPCETDFDFSENSDTEEVDD